MSLGVSGRSHFSLSPQAAGESHMDFRWLLHWKARRILKTTPRSWRGSDAEVQEGLWAVAGPARGQCQARSVGGAVHRAGGDAVRSGVVLGYGGLRGFEGRAVSAFFLL